MLEARADEEEEAAIRDAERSMNEERSREMEKMHEQVLDKVS